MRTDQTETTNKFRALRELVVELARQMDAAVNDPQPWSTLQFRATVAEYHETDEQLFSDEGFRHQYGLYLDALRELVHGAAKEFGHPWPGSVLTPALAMIDSVIEVIEQENR